MSREVVELMRTATVAEAHVVAALLRDNGIDAEAHELGVRVFSGPLLGARVLVRSTDLDRAARIVAQAQES